jgi:FkbM family methyltransferase
MSTKELSKTVLNRFGLEIRRLRRNPKFNTLGLNRLGIRTVIDVGANEGQFARYISGVLSCSGVYSFEPLSGAYARLKKWADSVTSPKITTFNVALGQEPSWIEIHEHIDLSPHSSLLATTELSHSLYPQTQHQRTERIRMDTLDNVFEHGAVELEPEILLKLDIQGYEDRVLRGASALLRRTRACLLEVNFDPLYQGQATFHDIYQILLNAGFRYAGCFHQTYGEDGHVITADEFFLHT